MFPQFQCTTVALSSIVTHLYFACVAKEEPERIGAFFNLFVFLSSEMPQDCHQVSRSFKLKQSQGFSSPFIKKKKPYPS